MGKAVVQAVQVNIGAHQSPPSPGTRQSALVCAPGPKAMALAGDALHVDNCPSSGHIHKLMDGTGSVNCA
jgi:hypothetical protein